MPFLLNAQKDLSSLPSDIYYNWHFALCYSDIHFITHIKEENSLFSSCRTKAVRIKCLINGCDLRPLSLKDSIQMTASKRSESYQYQEFDSINNLSECGSKFFPEPPRKIPGWLTPWFWPSDIWSKKLVKLTWTLHLKICEIMTFVLF